jgi:hypothetical protein
MYKKHITGIKSKWFTIWDVEKNNTLQTEESFLFKAEILN